MQALLTLFQIKTVRSAWVFLCGSGLMFLFGAYQLIINLGTHPIDPEQKAFDVVFFSVWFLVTGAYIALASWALFSPRGRSYVIAQEQIPIGGNRTVAWFLKFIFACLVAGFATLFFLAVLAVPFFGFVGLEAATGPDSWLYFMFLGLAWSPVVYRYLK